MYTLLIKESAAEANKAVRRLVETEGARHAFETKAAAEGLARRLSDGADRVRVQNAAPQERSEIDGYLVPHPRRFHAEPKDSERPGLTFDVGANLYGELGRALIYGAYGVSPAVKYYFYHRVEGIRERDHRIDVVPEPSLPDDLSADVSWQPDCLFRLCGRTDTEPRARYFAEIKTGAASFQRGQLDDMRRVAGRYDVLKVRVLIDGLPGEYTVRIEPVSGD